MPHAFNQSEHPFGQCEHFNQVEPFEKLWFTTMFFHLTINWFGIPNVLWLVNLMSFFPNDHYVADYFYDFLTL
jgi:hypothetical protein